MICEHKQKYSDDNCICDICIDSYLDLYNKVYALQLTLWGWKANLTTAEKDRINALLKPKEEEEVKVKPTVTTKKAVSKKKKSIKTRKPNKR